MRALKSLGWSLAIILILSTTGCGTFMAHRLVQAPNSYPTWFAPKARVLLGFDPNLFTNFPARFVAIGPPQARMRYRIVTPADYHFQFSSTSGITNGRRHFEFKFHATVPGLTNQWTAAPRGTVILLHGYGLAQFAMAPWALRLAEEGWRCVLVDLRGHGKSTGKQVFYGLHETHDLSQLLDQLTADNELSGSVAVMGESYGASLALRWQTEESRVQSVIAIAPYAVLSNAVLNISHEYANWMPDMFIKAGVKKLPAVLKVQPGELDPVTVMARSPVKALFIAAADDRITPLAEVEQLKKLARPESQLVVVPNVTHEAVTYFFDDLTPPTLKWLDESTGKAIK